MSPFFWTYSALKVRKIFYVTGCMAAGRFYGRPTGDTGARNGWYGCGENAARPGDTDSAERLLLRPRNTQCCRMGKIHPSKRRYRPHNQAQEGSRGDPIEKFYATIGGKVGHQ